jgi:hypothetical protein
MASYAYTFTSGDTMTPTKLNSARTVSEIVNADVSATAAIAGTKVAPAFGAQDITVSTANRSITNTGNFALSFGTNNTERMRIDASGNVGIGTTDATVGGGAMVVNHGANNGFVINQSTSASPATLYFRNTVDSTPAKIMFMGASGLTFADQNGNERMRIDASGNVGIGTTSPSAKCQIAHNGNTAFQVNNVATNDFVASRFVNDAGQGVAILSYGSAYIAGSLLSVGAGGVAFNSSTDVAFNVGSGKTIRFGVNAFERMRIDASGFVGINDTAPAYHLDVNGDANVTGVWRVDDTQVVTNRRTGWVAPTGTATRTAFATSTVTTAQLAERVKALIDDLTTHGLIGA